MTVSVIYGREAIDFAVLRAEYISQCPDFAAMAAVDKLRMEAVQICREAAEILADLPTWILLPEAGMSVISAMPAELIEVAGILQDNRDDLSFSERLSHVALRLNSLSKWAYSTAASNTSRILSDTLLSIAELGQFN